MTRCCELFPYSRLSKSKYRIMLIAYFIVHEHMRGIRCVARVRASVCAGVRARVCIYKIYMLTIILLCV